MINRVLLVADGGLDFSEADFGLGMFVRTLLDTPGSHVRNEITLAHIGSGNLMPAESRIATRIPAFAFDNPAHFGPETYDVVMLFGILETYPGRSPGETLRDAELRVLTEYMNSGGGLFATGDHGRLGRALSHRIPRVRGMRMWDSPADPFVGPVSMKGRDRNDTNRGGTFDHQSDDQPQVIDPKMYPASRIIPTQFPHPLLCGPRGVIRVMPDHPHEGQCIRPRNTNQDLEFGEGKEFPLPIAIGSRPLPEIISTNSVPSGNRATVPGAAKDATVAQTFGGISAYDGHRAGVGRVVTDATWHHFVNVNFRGLPGRPAPFDKGFLTPGASSVLAQIRAYQQNLAIWMSRPARLRCMNLRLVWGSLFSDRVMEAVLSTTKVSVRELSASTLGLIGAHARDAMGRVASQCLVLNLVLDLVLERALPDLIPKVDPWLPQREDLTEDDVPPDVVGWFDGSPLLDIALGGALVAIRENFEEPTPENSRELDTERMAEIIAEGGALAVRLGLESMADEIGAIREQLSW